MYSFDNCNKCYGFCYQAPYYYFIDENKVIHELIVNIQTSKLEETGEFRFKDIDYAKFKANDFNDLIIS